MKKLLSTVLCLSLMLGVCGCSSGLDEPADSAVAESAPTTIETTTEFTPSVETEPIITESVPVKLESNQVELQLNWTSNSAMVYDLDLIGFMLDKNGVCCGSDGFLFYNNPYSVDGSVELFAANAANGPDYTEKILIDLDKVSSDTDKISIWVLRYVDDSATQTNEGEFTVIKNDFIGNIMTVNGDFVLNQTIHSGKSYQVCELVRVEDGWCLQENGIVSDNGLIDICTSYGLMVD